MKTPIKIDDLGVPLFLETPIYIYIYFLGAGVVMAFLGVVVSVVVSGTLKNSHGYFLDRKCFAPILGGFP